MKKAMGVMGLAVSALLTGCGTSVEVPPAHVGKIMTKDGYQEAMIPTSKFRLAACWAYCDRLVLLNVSDNAYEETLGIFIPTDKLELKVKIRTTLSIDPKKTKELSCAIATSATSLNARRMRQPPHSRKDGGMSPGIISGTKT